MKKQRKFSTEFKQQAIAELQKWNEQRRPTLPIDTTSHRAYSITGRNTIQTVVLIKSNPGNLPYNGKNKSTGTTGGQTYRG